MSEPSHTTNKRLHREIGLFGLTANIVNTVIGAGIFILPATVAAVMGNMSIVAYLFCGALMMMIMLSFAEIGSKITVSGGAYSYIEIVWGRYPGFLAAFLFLLSTISADAAVANAIADVAGSLFPFMQAEFMRILLFFLIFSVLGYINIKGVRQGVGIVKLITLAKVIPLVFILLVGVKDLSSANLSWDSFPSADKIGEGSLLLFFAFLGAESALSVSGEVRNPQKNIPRAIIFSIGFVLVLYIFIQLISQAILGPALAETSENTLGQVANKIVGPAGLTLITIGMGVSMFGNLSSEILSIPRVLYAAAKDRLIPVKMLSKIHPKFATPYVAIIVYVLIDFIFASLGGLSWLILISSASILLIYLGVVLAVIKLRFKKGSQPAKGTFRIPGGVTIPVITVLAILWFLSNLSASEILSVSLFIVVLSVVFLIISSKNKKTSK
ncbi:APC family permease [uncultured Draconibacterium sp.]|uniref:APC family permease n=1 Tax=uncultured Draconibacterium sp. TaxID=1573823 RepID=UPI00261E0433|nr:amino acid permease [uncultured Draconibacterium sp.]